MAKRMAGGAERSVSSVKRMSREFAAREYNLKLDKAASKAASRGAWDECTRWEAEARRCASSVCDLVEDHAEHV